MGVTILSNSHVPPTLKGKGYTGCAQQTAGIFGVVLEFHHLQVQLEEKLRELV